MRLRIVSLLFLLAIVVVAAFAYRYLEGSGYFRELEFHQELECKPVLSVYGSEDITIDPDSGIAFISAQDRRSSEKPPGAIFTFSPGERVPINRTEEFDQEFHPRGIGLYSGTEGKYLFAINQRSSEETVEIFEVIGSTLRHQQTVRGNDLYCISDVIPVSPERFYLTRSHQSHWEFIRLAEEYLLLKRSSVLYFDGDQFSTAASGLGYASGINLSPDGTRLYVGATLEGAVHIYLREAETGRLEPAGKVTLETGVDNIEVDAEGTLWIAAHPDLSALRSYRESPDNPSPAQALRLTPLEDGGFDITELMLTPGRYLGAASVAAPRNGSLLVGSALDQRFLFCRIPDLQ